MNGLDKLIECLSVDQNHCSSELDFVSQLSFLKNTYSNEPTELHEVTCLLTLSFVSHSPESFTPRFDELFQLAEVIAMEFADANGEQEQEGFWNAVSRGEKLPPSSTLSPFEEFTKGLLERLFFANKTVEFERSAVKKTEAEQTDVLLQEARKLWRQKQIQQAVGVLRKFEREFALQIEKRDVSYSQRLQTVATENADKRILCVRGLLHREPLQRELQQRRVAFDSYLFKEPYVYSIAESVTIAFLHGEGVGDDTLVRLHIEQDYSNKEIAAGNFNYETRQRIREKVLSMTQADIDEYVGSMK